MIRSVPLFTQSEVALALRIPAARLSRAVRRGLVTPDFQTNQANLFLPRSVKRLARIKTLN
jgi:hypothetical protein